MIDSITKARVMTYKPRNTVYRVIHHNVKIKASNGSWELGCVYVEKLIDNTQLYTRPYSMFEEGKWEVNKTST